MQNDIVDKVKDYYDDTKDKEWERVAKDSYHKIEFYVTMELLKKYLPKSGVVLDAGGGPGSYSIELCKMEFDTVLYDLSPGNIVLAKEKFDRQDDDIKNHMKAFCMGDIQDFSRFKDNEFDAAICLGC